MDRRRLYLYYCDIRLKLISDIFDTENNSRMNVIKTQHDIIIIYDYFILRITQNGIAQHTPDR